jgi:K+ transporter
MQSLANFPPVRWAQIHPRLAAWIVLSLGMIIILFFSAREVGLLAGQWVALMVACVLVAGACIWIISWEDADDRETDATRTTEMQKVTLDTAPSDIPDNSADATPESSDSTA